MYSQVCMETAAGISGSVMMGCVCRNDGAVMLPVTARTDLMRWTVVCTTFFFTFTMILLHSFLWKKYTFYAISMSTHTNKLITMGLVARGQL